MAHVVRLPLSDDVEAMKALWESVFGDSRANIDLFFEYFYEPDMAMVTEVDGTIASAAYLIDIGEAVFPDGTSLPASVTYAVGTLPEYRGRGYGGDIVKKIVRQSFSKGFPLNVIRPAEAGLFGYYKSQIRCEEWFFAREYDICSRDITPAPQDASLRSVSAGEYNKIRDGILKGRFHIKYNEGAMGYQESLCAASGGALCAVTVGGAVGCAAVERSENGHVFIKELLSENAEGIDSVLSAVAAAFPGEKYSVRTPAVSGTASGDVRPFALAAAEIDLGSPALPPWYGLAFD